MFPYGARFSAKVAVTWYPPVNVYGAVGADVGEDLVLYDDDPDGVYDDPNFDGWAFVMKKENGQAGFFPEYYITDIRAMNPNKISKKANPQRPNNPPQKKTNGYPNGKNVNMNKHAPKSGGSCCCGGKPTGKTAKKRALELAVDEDDVETDTDDDDPEPEFGEQLPKDE